MLKTIWIAHVFIIFDCVQFPFNLLKIILIDLYFIIYYVSHEFLFFKWYSSRNWRQK